MIDPAVDPWSWPEVITGDEVRKLSEASDMTPKAPIFQYGAVLQVRALKPAIEGGSGFAVMEAVAICAGAGLVMPSWLAVAFRSRYLAVVHYKAKGWSDDRSFGEANPKGTHVGKERRYRLLGLRIRTFVRAQLDANVPLRAACETLSIEMDGSPQNWDHYKPDARTIERIYLRAEKDYGPF